MKTLLYALVLAVPSLLLAQKGDIELGGNIGIGASQISLQSDDFNPEMGLNIQGEAFANYFFSDNLGVSFGVGINSLQSTATATNYQSIISEGTDPTGDYQILVYTDDYQEIERLTMLEIPIGLVFRKDMNKDWSFRAGVGFKVGLPVAATYQLEQGICTRLYYPDIMKDESEAICDIPAWGLYEDRTDWDQSSGDLETKINISPFINIGASYKIKEKLSLYGGLYAAYGISDVVSDNQSQLLTASTATEYNYHSPTTFTKNNTFEVGIKVGILFDLTKKHSHTANNNTAQIAHTADKPNATEQSNISPQEATTSTTTIPQEALATDEDEKACTIDDVAGSETKPESENNEVQPLEDATEPITTTAAPATQETPVAEKEKETNVADKASITIDHYSMAGDKPNDTQTTSLQEQLQTLNKDKGIYFLIAGHTCDMASKKRNRQVGHVRAEELKALLVKEGIAPSHILTTSYGETQPKYANDTEEHRGANRRAEVSMYVEEQVYTIPSYSNSETLLANEQSNQLQELINTLKANASMMALITGHTCDLGDAEVNLTIGHMRANNLKQFFVKNNIAAQRIITASEGEDDPKFENDNEEHRAANRRVEIMVLEKKVE